jgi:hypothetical protein
MISKWGVKPLAFIGVDCHFSSGFLNHRQPFKFDGLPDGHPPRPHKAFPVVGFVAVAECLPLTAEQHFLWATSPGRRYCGCEGRRCSLPGGSCWFKIAGLVSKFSPAAFRIITAVFYEVRKVRPAFSHV